ncbi:MAG: insulinase family protein [Cytophagales bacterium]|nr:insulinase family protein [Cytophagales bacterium]
MNHIFGGYFGSRLMKNIREDKGLTYGIYSSINNLKNDAYLVIAARC